MMEYREFENLIYRCPVSTKRPGGPMTEVLMNGAWERAGRAGLDARLQGAQMTESEAKTFQGDGWPEEDSQSREGEAQPPKASSVASEQGEASGPRGSDTGSPPPNNK